MKLFDVYPLYPVEPVRGRGCFVYDAAGTEYLDLYGGHAVISIGHAHPHYVRMISEQAARLGFYSNSVENSLQTALAEKLGRASGYGDYMTSAMRCSKALYLQSLEYEQAVSTSLIAMWPTFTLLILDEQYRISEETAASWRESARTMRAMMAAGMTNEASVSQSEANCRPGGSFAARPPAAGKGNAARSAFYPSITLSGTAGWTNSAGSMIVNPGKLLLSVIDSLTQPLFNKGLNVAQLKMPKHSRKKPGSLFSKFCLMSAAK